MGNMKFTEEEFYGNTQNTVLASGEVVPTNAERRGKNSGSRFAVDIISTFVKTIVILVGFLFYSTSVMVCFSPNTAIRMFDLLGAERASLACYERIYGQEGTLASLYNLVQKSIQNKNYDKTVKYINELQGKSEYVEFCVKVNAATINTTAKEYIAYVGDLDGYLVSQNIMAEYNAKHKESAREVALLDLNNTNIYSFGFSSFMECLESDKSLTSDEIKSQILEIINTKVDGEQVLELIKQRRALVDILQANESLQDKILRVYTSLKIEKALYKIYLIQGEEVLKTQTAQNIQNLQSKYSELIK